MSVSSPGSSRFLVLFKNDTGFRYVYFIKSKPDVFDKFRKFEKVLLNQFDRTIKILKCDNGREYCNEKFKRYLADQGITIGNSAPYSPEQNGKIELDNRTVIECARTMLQAKGLPQQL